MTAHTLPTYQELSQALLATPHKSHASQVHGLICGLLSGQPHSDGAWEEAILGYKPTGPLQTLLQQVYEQSKQQLQEFLFELQLLLPTDDEQLAERAEALSLWCQGYLTGLKIAQIPLEDRAPSETTEAIQDLVEIAKMNYEEVVEDEEDESAYAELVEYVRMAVILIYQDLHGNDRASPRKAERLH